MKNILRYRFQITPTCAIKLAWNFSIKNSTKNEIDLFDVKGPFARSVYFQANFAALKSANRLTKDAEGFRNEGAEHFLKVQHKSHPMA